MSNFTRSIDKKKGRTLAPSPPAPEETPKEPENDKPAKEPEE